ncbi:winged helix-turn-helix domain-containing protein [Variovorax sp. EL159]|uniref:winged helix-turn-helix domain-containing protein n=1 Tax=Variovorax sp. EL159 TaxID=1566270 RepID=UPI00159FBA88|nr:winged helix-turn-helix domain-containing protein [Variovorax sp. EL159]
MKMMTGVRGALSIAILGSDGARTAALQGRLDRMGHQSVVFAGTPDFLTTLSNGVRFSLLLLLAPQDDMTNASLRAVCKVLGMPALLAIQDGGRERLLSMDDDAQWNDALDLEAPTAMDAELDWQIHLLLQRAGNTQRQEAHAAGDTLVRGDYRFLGGSNTVLHHDREIILQPRQFAFALALFRNVGEVLTRGWLQKSLWKDAPQREGARALDVCAAGLRRRLDLRHENGFVLRAVYGTGYQLMAVPSSSNTSRATPARK